MDTHELRRTELVAVVRVSGVGQGIAEVPWSCLDPGVTVLGSTGLLGMKALTFDVSPQTHVYLSCIGGSAAALAEFLG